MHNSHELAGVIFNRQSHDSVGLHAVNRCCSQFFGPGGLWISSHDLSDRAVQEVSVTFHEAGEIAGREHTCNTAVLVDYRYGTAHSSQRRDRFFHCRALTEQRIFV